MPADAPGAEPSPDGGPAPDSLDAPPTLPLSQLARDLFPAPSAASGPSALTEHPDIGRYVVKKRLDGGGMGDVYLAFDKTLCRDVALKVVRGSHDPEILDRFHREAHASAGLEHPHIVRVHDVGSLPQEVGGNPYYAMELLRGEDMAKAAAAGRLTPRDAVGAIRQAAQALAYAHSKGILHRDVKPQNIFLRGEAPAPPSDGPTVRGEASSTGGREIDAVLLDFGLAKLVEKDLSSDKGGATDRLGTLTRTGQLLGTPAYMAPEQARGLRTVDARTDVYGLGAALYYALVGEAPFQATTLADMMSAVIGTEPVPPRRKNRNLSADVETICLKCLEKDPARRYADAGKLAEDCRRYLAGEAIVARPIGRLERGWRWCRRRPTRAVSVALGIVFAAVLAGIWSHLAEKWRTAYLSDFADASRRGEWKASGGSLAWEDGAMCLGKGEGAATIALSRGKYFGDIRLEYTARIMADSPTVNDLSCFILGSDSIGFGSGYYFGVGGNMNTRSHLLRLGWAVVAANTEFRLERGKKYHIVVERKGSFMSVTVDGRRLYEYEDYFPIPEVDGSVGFYTESHTHIEKVRIQLLQRPAFPSKMTEGDIHYGHQQWLSAAQLYAQAEGEEGAVEGKELARFKRAVALHQDGRGQPVTHGEELKDAKAVFGALAASAASPRLRLHARVQLAQMTVEGGDPAAGGRLLAEGFDALAGTSDRFVVLNAVLGLAGEMRSKYEWEPFRPLVKTFCEGISHKVLVEVGADNFNSVCSHYLLVLGAEGRRREAIDLCKELVQRQADAGASGEFQITGERLLTQEGAVDEACKWRRDYLKNLLRVRALQRAYADIPLEKDLAWGQRYAGDCLLAVGSFCDMGRIEDARALLGETLTLLSELEKLGLGKEVREKYELELESQVALAQGDRAEMRRLMDRCEAKFHEDARPPDTASLNAYLCLLAALVEYDKIADLFDGKAPDCPAQRYLAGRVLHPATRDALVAVRPRAEVMACLDQLLRAEPDNLELLYLRGRIAPEELESRLAPFCLIGPHRIPFTLALGYELKGDNEKALREYRRCLSMNPPKNTVVVEWYFATHALERLK